VTRWDSLFADLEAQADAWQTAERALEVEERARVEAGGLRLVDRLRPAVGTPIRLRCLTGAVVAGVLRRAGSDWVLLDDAAGRETVVAVGAVLEISGLGRAAAVPGSEGVVDARLTLRHALRGLVRDRAGVALVLADGRVVDGTLDRVGSDFVELAEHAAGEPRRRDEVREVVVVPLTAIVLVRRVG
jgi:hypothetical protein